MSETRFDGRIEGLRCFGDFGKSDILPVKRNSIWIRKACVGVRKARALHQRWHETDEREMVFASNPCQLEAPARSIDIAIRIFF